MGKGSSSAPSADPRIGEAAIKNVELGNEWLDFAKSQSEVANERQKTTDALTTRVTEQALATAEKNNAIADEQYAYYKDTFQPVEKQMVDEANNYDSAERKDAVAGQAAMEVGKQFAATRDANTRNMARMGINPNSGKFQASANSTAVQEALGKASASTKARTDAENMGIMLRKDAANFGRNMTGTAAQAYSTGLNAGNAAVGSNATANQTWASNNAIMTNGYSGAMSANNSAANILNSQYGNQLNAWAAENSASAASSGGWGQMAGMLGSAAITQWSDKTKKEDKAPVDENAVLKAIRKTPVEQWKYKDGVEDGGHHIGPYAQDVQKNLGEKAGPGGRMIDLVSLNGINMAAIQALDKKVQKLEKKARAK